MYRGPAKEDFLVVLAAVATCIAPVLSAWGYLPASSLRALPGRLHPSETATAAGPEPAPPVRWLPAAHPSGGPEAYAASPEAYVPSMIGEDARRRLGLVHLLGRYSTYFDPALRGRVANLRRAAAAIDGLLLQPGQEFSFNDVVGPRTPETGYVEAPELVAGELVPGVGGGICQLSSTLYNAVLYTALRVTERVHHSRPLGYVPPGRDATVYDDVLDLRFVNTEPDPVLLSAEMVENRLTVAIWGSRPSSREVKIEQSEERRLPPPVEFIADPSLPPGSWKVERRGGDGVEVVVFRLVYDAAGQLVHRERLYRDFYAPRSYAVRAGPGVDREAVRHALRGDRERERARELLRAWGLP